MSVLWASKSAVACVGLHTHKHRVPLVFTLFPLWSAKVFIFCDCVVVFKTVLRLTWSTSLADELTGKKRSKPHAKDTIHITSTYSYRCKVKCQMFCCCRRSIRHRKLLLRVLVTAFAVSLKHIFFSQTFGFLFYSSPFNFFHNLLDISGLHATKLFWPQVIVCLGTRPPVEGWRRINVNSNSKTWITLYNRLP